MPGDASSARSDRIPAVQGSTACGPEVLAVGRPGQCREVASQQISESWLLFRDPWFSSIVTTLGPWQCGQPRDASAGTRSRPSEDASGLKLALFSPAKTTLQAPLANPASTWCVRQSPVGSVRVSPPAGEPSKAQGCRRALPAQTPPSRRRALGDRRDDGPRPRGVSTLRCWTPARSVQIGGSVSGCLLLIRQR